MRTLFLTHHRRLATAVLVLVPAVPTDLTRQVQTARPLLSAQGVGRNLNLGHRPRRCGWNRKYSPPPLAAAQQPTVKRLQDPHPLSCCSLPVANQTIDLGQVMVGMTQYRKRFDAAIGTWFLELTIRLPAVLGAD